jgi:hypothetical protein
VLENRFSRSRSVACADAVGAKLIATRMRRTASSLARNAACETESSPVRPIVLAAVAAALVLGFGAGVAQAMIVPQRSIAGITLEMSKAQVRAKLGAPPRVRRGRNDFGAWTQFVYPRVDVTFQSGNAVTALQTTSPKERTVRGAHVGSTKAELRARVRGLKCEPGHCFLGSFTAGKRVTDFFLRRGRVTRIVVGFVID